MNILTPQANKKRDQLLFFLKQGTSDGNIVPAIKMLMQNSNVSEYTIYNLSSLFEQKMAQYDQDYEIMSKYKISKERMGIIYKREHYEKIINEDIVGTIGL